MGVIKLLLICSLSVCVLASLYAANLLHISWLWAANLQSNLTPSLLFLLLNLVMGALFLINLKGQQGQQAQQHSQEAHPGKEVLPHSNSAAVSSNSRARGMPPKEAPQNLVVRKQFAHSKSDKLPAMAPSVSTSNSSNVITDLEADQTIMKKKKKKKKGSSSSADQGERSDIENASLKASSSAPSPFHGNGADDNEVDRRAEDFISKFYLQMKMQRLESLQRYTQRMDRSHGR